MEAVGGAITSRVTLIPGLLNGERMKTQLNPELEERLLKRQLDGALFRLQLLSLDRKTGIHVLIQDVERAQHNYLSFVQTHGDPHVE